LRWRRPSRPACSRRPLYFLIDLYFVAQLGDTALAGVGAAGTAMFVVMALTQMLGVGAMALVSQAVGRKDHDDADLVFNQSLSLAGFCTVGTFSADTGSRAITCRPWARMPRRSRPARLTSTGSCRGSRFST
jgi:hypothetical protein